LYKMNGSDPLAQIESLTKICGGQSSGTASLQ
jgi:hypothetical protein